MFFCFFFFNDTATTEIYTLSLHDALPICGQPNAKAAYSVLGEFLYGLENLRKNRSSTEAAEEIIQDDVLPDRSEEHTSELQSQSNLVCRLLLEKKKRI